MLEPDASKSSESDNDDNGLQQQEWRRWQYNMQLKLGKYISIIFTVFRLVILYAS